MLTSHPARWRGHRAEAYRHWRHWHLRMARGNYAHPPLWVLRELPVEFAAE
ncbi:MAG: hypothetical protein ACRYFV_19365 [Janthinobacterium lividum]